METNFQDKLNGIFARARASEHRREAIPTRAKLFNLVKVQGGERRIVGFRLLKIEAERLAHNLKTKMERINEPDGTGKPIFEMTEILIEKEV